MNKYLIESNHTAEECVHVLDLVVAHGYITHYDWGCEAGVHSGWVIIEAESEEEAMLSVPTAMRPKARVVKLNKFTPQMIEEFHKELKP
jgi:hypothetical protein